MLWRKLIMQKTDGARFDYEAVLKDVKDTARMNW